MFQLLLIDLFSPMNTLSLGGKKYELVIIDEYSIYTWVFFLKAKSDVVDELIKFIKRMKTMNNKRIEMIRSDNETNLGIMSWNHFAMRRESHKFYLLQEHMRKMGL